MQLLNAEAIVKCDHDGEVEQVPTQELVYVDDIQFLVHEDPEKREIQHCPNFGPNAKPCKNTLKVREGYSTLVFIQDRCMVLDSLKGYTDGTPPGAVDYTVRDPGQEWVGSDA